MRLSFEDMLVKKGIWLILQFLPENVLALDQKTSSIYTGIGDCLYTVVSASSASGSNFYL